VSKNRLNFHVSKSAQRGMKIHPDLSLQRKEKNLPQPLFIKRGEIGNYERGE